MKNGGRRSEGEGEGGRAAEREGERGGRELTMRNQLCTLKKQAKKEGAAGVVLAPPLTFDPPLATPLLESLR